MMWLVFALLAAAFQSIVSIFSKKELYKKHAMEFATLNGMYIAAYSIILLFFLQPANSWKVLLIIYAISWNLTILMLLRAKAMRHLDLSVYSPLTNISPLFLIIIAYILLGETLNFIQYMGVFLIIVGAYALEASHHFTSVFEPIKKIFMGKYHMIAIVTLILASFGSALDKLIVSTLAQPLAYICYIWIFNGFNIILIDFFRFRLKDVRADLRSKSWPIAIISLASMISNVFYILAVSMQLISLVIP